MDIFEKINGKCYKITFSKRVKHKSAKYNFLQMERKLFP